MCSPCDCGKNDGADSRLSELTLTELRRCRRCGSEAFVLIDKVRVECKQCFLDFCNKKFRTTIGKSKLVKNNEPIIMAYSGGLSSTALLDLIHSNSLCENRREQKFKVTVLHVDTSCVLLGQDADRQSGGAINKKRAQDLLGLLRKLSHLYPEWPVYFTTLEQYFKCNLSNEETKRSMLAFLRFNPELDEDSIERFIEDENALEKLVAALQECSDLTDKQQLITDCCISLIDQIAFELNQSIEIDQERFKYVFTGSGATQLAQDMLVNVITGRGSTIGPAVNICDRRTKVPIMRPLREFSKKEITFYLNARDIHQNVVLSPNLMTFADRKASIQTVTEAFLSKLFLDYPSTYSTLLRTGSKMTD